MVKCKLILEINGEKVETQFNTKRKDLKKDGANALNQIFLMVVEK